MGTTFERLSNGLSVVFKESHAAPVVAFQMWIGVGSADERDNESGLAHVLEHMVFKGTKKRGVGEIARDIERAGGYINAWTSHDETVFHITMASRFASKGLDVLADAVRNAALDENELERELQVILEEIRMGEDNPSRVTAEMLFSKVFTRHPYGRPVIGRKKTVESFGGAKVKRFYKRWYTPANSVLVVVGDFNRSSMIKEVRKSLGSWGKGVVPRRDARTKEPYQRKTRCIHRVLPVSEVSLAIGFPIPGFSNDDVPVLDILAAVLGQGASSRLEVRIRRELGVVNDIRAISFTPKDGGIFGVFATTQPYQVERAVKEIGALLVQLASEPISQKEIEKARALLMSESIYSEETVDGIAKKLGYYSLHSGDIEYEKRYMASLSTLNQEQLMEVARKYFETAKATIAVVVPKSVSKKSADKLSWVRSSRQGSTIDGVKLQQSMTSAFERGDWVVERPRKSSTSKSETVSLELPGGDVLIVRPDSESRIVAARAAFLGGLRFEPADKAGISMLLSNCLTRGTTTKSASEITMKMDTLACSVTGFAGRNSFGIQGEFLSGNFADGFAIMAECLSMPALSKEEVDREKELLLDDINASKDNLDFLAFKLFQKSLFGHHPYGRPILGTEQTVAALKERDARDYLRKVTGPGRMVLAVVGGVETKEVFDLAKKYLVNRFDGKPYRNPKAWKPIAGPRIVRETLHKEQSHIVLGFPGATITSEERFSVEVLTEMLGGHGGRLFSRVREEQGLAYSITATSMEGIEPGYIALYAATSPGQEQCVVDSMLNEINRIKNEKPTLEETNRVKRYLIGVRAISAQRASSRAASSSLGYLYGLGPDMDQSYPVSIGRVDGEKIVMAASKFLDESKMVVSCVGPSRDPLELAER